MCLISVIGAGENFIQLKKRLCEVLGRYGGAADISNEGINIFADEKNKIEYAVIDASSFSQYVVSYGIAVFDFSDNASIASCSLTEIPICLMCEEDTKSLTILNKSKNPTITCGMSLRSTITASSITDESAMISIQREIKNIYGLTIPQGDIPVRLTKKTDDYQIMLIVAILLLTLNVGEEYFII